MKPYYEASGVTIYCGDCFEVMPTLEAESADAIVCDPPYGLAFMGKAWDHGVPGVPFWAEALRVAKPGAHLLAFGGTRTFHRLTCAIEDAGWEIRDCLSWLHGSGFPKSKNIGGGRGTALKPAWEPIILARKPLIGTVASNVQQHGTGALNIDGCRIRYDADDMATRTARTGTQAGRKYGSAATVTLSGGELAPVNPAGRWPANVVLDEEAAGMLDAQSGDRPGMASQVDTKDTPSAYFGAHKKAGVRIGRGDTGGASRFFYTAKASRSEREEGLEGFRKKQAVGGGGGIGNYLLDVNAASGKYGSEKAPSRNHHPTVKPLDLMRWLCRLVTPPNGLILDPFMGSGSTGCAAVLEGFRFIGIEREAEYVEIARARIAYWYAQHQPLLITEEAG